MKEKQLEDFQINDTYVFRRTFSEKDFSAFSELSGDENPLHYDKAYAEKTQFAKPIVPLHLAASPLSAVAGMVFPGHRSLYLSHQLKALHPVPYDVELTYSAKVIAIDSVNRILTIRTVVFQHRLLLIEAEQKIQVRDEGSQTTKVEALSHQGVFIQPSNAVLVTGAAGALGQCVTNVLARHGYDLVLQVRESNAVIQEVCAAIQIEYDVNVDIIECDLNIASVDNFAELFEDINQTPSYVVHCASPALTADLNTLINVNYLALKYLSDALLPEWLEQQFGTLIFVSSSATHFHPEGWQDYCAAKAAGVNFCASFNHRFQTLGLNAKVISPGLIATDFSANTGLSQDKAMLPEQVADTIVEMLNSQQQFYTWVEQGVTRSGSYGFFATQDHVIPSQTSVMTNKTSASSSALTNDLGDLEQRLQALIRAHIGLSEEIDWQSSGVAVTPKWDSLNHMLLLVEIERQFGTAFTSTDMDRTTTYQQLLSLVEEKIARTNNHNKL